MPDIAGAGVIANGATPGAPPAVEIATAVERLLTEFLAAETASMRGLDPSLEPMVAVARQLVLAGGKRLRSTFAYWGWRGAAGPDRTLNGQSLNGWTLDGPTLDDRTVHGRTVHGRTLNVQTLNVQTLDDRTLDDRALGQRALDGRTLNGQTLEDQALSGRATDGRATDGRALDERALDERALDERALDAVLPALAALELLHTCALVHDDVMDDSDTRRGLPTAHRAVAAHHRALGLPGDPDEFGRSAAILIGDLCMVWADRLACAARLPAATLLAARRGYDRMRVEAIAGQFLDLLGDAAPATTSARRALRVARLKTASYTVARPLIYGAALAGVTEESPLSRAYARYGFAVGEAFQLRDDLLGVYGDPRVTGKPVGEDLARGKSTVLLELARTMAVGSDAAELRELLARRAPADLPRLAALLARAGAVDELDRMIGERVAWASAAVAEAPLDPETREALGRLASTASRRES